MVFMPRIWWPMCESMFPAETTRNQEGSFIISCNGGVIVIFVPVIITTIIITIITIVITTNLYLWFPFSLVGKITVGPKLDCPALGKSRLGVRLQLNLELEM